MMLDDVLAGVGRLGLDTSPFIYFIESHPQHNRLVTDVFQRIASGQCTGITSVITLSEVLVQPLLRGNTRLSAEYRDLLLHSENLQTLSIDSVAAESAADLRARYRIRMPDALQIAVALSAGCETFLTNDLALRRVTELRVLVLDELELSIAP